MITAERFETYCETIYPAEAGLLAELEGYAAENDVPIIRPAARRYLRWLLRTIRPKSILELGTAIGFSAILMAEALPDAGIVTIENYEKRIPIARENISRAGVDGRITLLEGDAEDLLKQLNGGSQNYHVPKEGFDFVFIDAAKAQYERYLELLMPLIHPGTVLVCDNVLAQDSGSILDSHYAIERRDRTIHDRMRHFLKQVTADERYVTDLSMAGDGIFTITVM
ncbi:MAG: O-methyltransferase [Lachnospiraceae bacterium]|nr:O-methyltransferase [Lachnospiraceae bacterium]